MRTIVVAMVIAALAGAACDKGVPPTSPSGDVSSKVAAPPASTNPPQATPTTPSPIPPLEPPPSLWSVRLFGGPKGFVPCPGGLVPELPLNDKEFTLEFSVNSPITRGFRLLASMQHNKDTNCKATTGNLYISPLEIKGRTVFAAGSPAGKFQVQVEIGDPDCVYGQVQADVKAVDIVTNAFIQEVGQVFDSRRLVPIKPCSSTPPPATPTPTPPTTPPTPTPPPTTPPVPPVEPPSMKKCGCDPPRQEKKVGELATITSTCTTGPYSWSAEIPHGATVRTGGNTRDFTVSFDRRGGYDIRHNGEICGEVVVE